MAIAKGASGGIEHIFREHWGHCMQCVYLALCEWVHRAL